MSRPTLNLVWINEAELAQPPRNRSTGNKQPQSDHQLVGRWGTVLTVGISLISLVGVGAFYFGTLQLRTESGERVVKIETTMTDLEKKVDFLIGHRLQDSKAQAEKILNARAIQVAYVTPTSKVVLPSLNRISTASKSASNKSEFFVTCTIEGFLGGNLILRAQIQEELAGRVVRTLHDRRMEIKPPTRLGERVTHDFVMTNEKDNAKSLHPPIRIELVVLERVGTDGLIVATGIAPTPKSPAG